MSSEYGQKSFEQLQTQLRQMRQQAEDAVPCFSVTEQNWKGLLALEQKHSELLLSLLKQQQNLMTEEEMGKLLGWQTEQLSSLTTQTAAMTEQYQKTLTAEAKVFTNAAQTAVSDLSKQAGSVSDSFSSALRNERSEMQRYRRRLFWISLLPTAITLASLLAWTLWQR